MISILTAGRRCAIGTMVATLCCVSMPSLAQSVKKTVPLKSPLTPAVLLDAAQCVPTWPEAAIGLGESGTASLLLRVGPDGTVSNATVASSSGFQDLDDATIAAASKCKFSPALKKGKPVVSSVPFTHVWTLPAPAPAPGPPKALCKKPEYPAASIRYEEQGTVTLSFLIGIDGKVVDKKIIKSSGFVALDTAALNAIAKCSFRPATADGKPEQSWQPVQYVWSLR